MDHNLKGSTRAFATFTPYKSKGDGRWSSWTLRLGETHTLAARKPKFLHTAQFCPVSAEQLRRAGLAGKGLENGGLLFLSSFNGPSVEYFRGFSEKLDVVLDEVWTWCVGWNKAKPFKSLMTFINTYERRSGSFFNAYPEESQLVRAALVLRRELDDLHALALSKECDAQTFAAAFKALSQRQWGNAD